MAVITESFTIVKDAAGVLPKVTAVIPLNFVPLRVTMVPAVPIFGVNESTDAGGINVKPGRETVPAGVVTAMLPD